LPNSERTAETCFLAFHHVSWNDLRGIFGATSFDSDEKVREELNTLLKIKVTGAEKNKVIYLVVGDTVLECSGPVAHPSGQGAIFAVERCYKLSHDIFDLISSSGQLLKMRWNIIVPGHDYQSLMDNRDVSDALQFELPESEHTAFLNQMTDSNPQAGNRPVTKMPPFGAAVNQVPADSSDCFRQVLGKAEIDQQVVLLKDKYPPLNWDSAPLPEIAAALTKWSFSPKDERKKFVACIMSGSIISVIKDCLSQMDPPVYFGGENEFSELYQQLIQVWQQLTFTQETLDFLTNEIQTIEQLLSLLDQYGKHKSEENTLIRELDRLKKMPVPAVRFNPALFFYNIRLSRAFSRITKNETMLLKSQQKQLNQLMQMQAGTAGFGNTRPSGVQRKYERSLRRLSDLLDRYSARYGGLVADQAKVAVQYKLSGIQSELASLSGLLAKFSQTADSPEARADLAKNLRKIIAADRFNIALLQGIYETKNAPVPSIALEFLDKPSLFLLDSQNTGSCELLAALSPKLVLIDQTVNPNLWLKSSRLVLQWINNTLTPLGGSTIPGIEKTMEQLRTIVKSNNIDEEGLCKAFPGITSAMAGYFIRNLSQ